MTKTKKVQEPDGFNNWSTYDRLIWILIKHYGYSEKDAIVKAEEIEKETFANSEIFKSFTLNGV